MKWIGRYRVMKLLGQGGMGRIYKVFRPELGRVMALKLLKPEQLQEDLWGAEELRRLFFQEVRIMGGLDHENVAAVLDLGEAEGRPFAVLEYYCLNLGTLIGETYRMEAPTRRLMPEKAIDYAQQALNGLGRLHHAGIVHRDVKPYNLMVTRDDCIKLIDFGLSRLRGERPPRRPKGAIIGSPYYAAPEQESHPDQAGPQADLFSLAVLFYRLLTGSLPDEGLKALEGETFYSQAWSDFFRKALSQEPSRRYADAWEMHEALQQLKESWRETRDRACKLSQGGLHREAHEAPSTPPRSRPMRTGPVKMVPFPGLTDLYQPAVYQPNAFRRRGESCLEDRSSGLIWLVKAPPLALSWEEAWSYAASLSEEPGNQAEPWRLPTVEELLTLLQPRFRPEDFCVPAVLGGQKRCLWSADERTCSAAWFVDAENGSVLWQDKTCAFWVLPVRSGQESSDRA